MLAPGGFTTWFLSALLDKWGFPKIRGTYLGVPRIRIIVFQGLHRGPLILGNYQILHGVGYRVLGF